MPVSFNFSFSYILFYVILCTSILLFKHQRLLLYFEPLLLQNQPSPRTINWLLDNVLNLNNFIFNNHNFIQVKGTAMGTGAAPNDANVCMGQLEDRFVYRTPRYNHIIHWISFINDIFLIWKGGDSDSLNTFIEYLNSVVLSIKFTHEMSSTTMNFLDTKLKSWRTVTATDVYQKPTDTHSYTCIGRQHIHHF